jgi:uncharacterized protein
MAAVRTTDSLAGVTRHEWDGLVDDDGFYLSHDWLRYVETEPYERSRYLLSPDSGVLAGALVLNWVRDAFTVRYRGEHFADLLGIEGRTLIAGGSRGYRSTLLLAPSGASRAETLAALLRAALAVAREDGCAGIVLPFLTTPALAEVAGVARMRAAFDIPEAEITGVGPSLDAYAERAPRRVRGRIRADRARFARAGWVVRERRLDECWPDTARLLYLLQRKHGHAERTLRDFEESMAGQARDLADRSAVFTCEDDRGIAGMVVCYRWRTTLYARVAGFDYDRLRHGHEYFNVVLYGPLQYVAREGMSRLHLGPGSWEAKGYRGAVLRPLWSAFIPVTGLDDAPGLELVNGESVREWVADITRRGLRTDSAEWEAPELLAAAGAGAGK